MSRRGADVTKVMAPELRPEALRAGLIADPAFAETLLTTFQSTNQETYRRDIVYAFAGSGDPAVIGKMLNLGLGKMRIGELRYLNAYMQDEPVARQALWNLSACISATSPNG